MSNKVEEILSSILGISADTITDDLSMKDLASWDSLKHMEVITTIEGVFAVQLTFDQIVAMQSVGAIKHELKVHGVET